MRRLSKAEQIDLVALVLAGHAAAWCAFVLQFRRLLAMRVRATAVAMGVEPTPEDVEDLVGETWVSLLDQDRRQLRRFDPARASLSTWLGLVARSAASNTITMQRTMKRRGTAHGERKWLENMRDDGPGPHAVAEQHQEDARLRAALDRLRATGVFTERGDLVVRLTLLRGWDGAEVAEALGVSRQRVSQITAAAPARIRQAMAAPELRWKRDPLQLRTALRGIGRL